MSSALSVGNWIEKQVKVAESMKFRVKNSRHGRIWGEQGHHDRLNLEIPVIDKLVEIDIILDLKELNFPPDVIIEHGIEVNHERLVAAIADGWDTSKDDCLYLLGKVCLSEIVLRQREKIMEKVTNSIAQNSWEVTLRHIPEMNVLVKDKSKEVWFYIPLKVDHWLKDQKNPLNIPEQVQEKLHKLSLLARFPCTGNHPPILSFHPVSISTFTGLETLKKKPKFKKGDLLKDHVEHATERVVKAIRSLESLKDSRKRLINELIKKLGAPLNFDDRKFFHATFLDHTKGYKSPVILQVNLPESYPRLSPEVKIISLRPGKIKVRKLRSMSNTKKRKRGASDDAVSIIHTATKECQELIGVARRTRQRTVTKD